MTAERDFAVPSSASGRTAVVLTAHPKSPAMTSAADATAERESFFDAPSYRARVLCDSVSPGGHRLTTMEVTFPRFVLGHVLAHRVFSRNTASSRAIPVVKQMRRALLSPYVPMEFGTNRPGMQAGPPLDDERHAVARREWLRARDLAVLQTLRLITDPDFVDGVLSGAGVSPESLLSAVDRAARHLNERPTSARHLGTHKQIANRLLEPFLWQTVIVTATEWRNFFALRCHPDADPALQYIAVMMRTAYDDSTPNLCGYEEWHLPLVGDAQDRHNPLVRQHVKEVAVGRCARVSYLTHDGVRDPAADIRLHDRLASAGHLSPFEHVARPMRPTELRRGGWTGNLRGWHQYRKDIPNEDNFSKVTAAACSSSRKERRAPVVPIPSGHRRHAPSSDGVA